ncbi:MAG: ATP-dependent DNA ligase [candidate division Zixibacteria bacterium]|nr:ATP-dependent DNA ligase [candidate division Zixibacteria bacterium]
MKIGKYEIEISNSDKVFFPDDGITKGDLVNYYAEIGDTMLKYTKDRAIAMLRFPDGIDGEGFYQKDASDYFPDWIETENISKKGGTVNHVVCNNADTLVYIANQGCITPHIWLSKIGNLNNPDRLIFDLDPSEGGFKQVREAAEIIRDFLTEELELIAYVMTTGSKGLHVVTPLKPELDFDKVRGFARDVADILAERFSDKLTAEISKEKRKGRLFLDTARNAYAQTAVTPYSVRPKPGAPVATPIEWDELKKSELGAQSYNIKNIFRRLSQKEDPWAKMDSRARSLKKSINMIESKQKKRTSS